MTKVKICGLKFQEDVEAVNRLLPEYAGFVFAPGKRQLTLEKARFLIGKLDSRIQSVGVFVNAPPEQVKDIADRCNLEVIQFHGEETPEYCSQFQNGQVWKGFSVKGEADIAAMGTYQVAGYLLDSCVKGQAGGTGIPFDWQSAAQGQRSFPRPLILAGGLTAENVGAGIALFQPEVVDVSSGVEEQGRKSFEKIEAFINQVRRGSNWKQRC